VVDSNGLPVRLALSPGEAHDVRPAGKLLSPEIRINVLLADRGYDTDWIRKLAMKKGASAQYPAEKQSQRSDLLQPVSLPRSQPGRAVLQQDQTMPSGGDAL
jgi:transposase